MEGLTEPVELARLTVDLIGDLKGENIVLMDLQKVSVIADYFVIGQANSDRQINAVIERIREGVKEKFATLPLRVEGKGESGWVLMDYGTVIVHIFSPQARAYYDLETLWKEAPVILRMQ